MTILLIN